MKVPYNRAQLSVRCNYHNCDLEYYPDEDATGILDRLQLVCPGLSPMIRDLHAQSARLDHMARKWLGKQWLADNPAQAKMYPKDYVPTDKWSYEQYPDNYKQALQELDRQEEEAAEACMNSWVVRLTIREEVRT
jgi:hypothetical protein